MSRAINSDEQLRDLPNVGPATERDLYSLDIRTVAGLKGKDPQALYDKLEQIAGAHVDRCMLYVMRSLVYMAESGERDMKKVAWWHFKDVPKK